MRNIERRLDKARETARKSAGERAERDAEDQARRDREAAARRAEAEVRDAEEAEAQPEPTADAPLIAGIALLGGGIALAGAGGAVGGLAVATRQDALTLCKDVQGDLICPASAGDALDRDQRLSLGSDALFAIGAGIATTGIILIVVHLAGGDEAVARAPVSPTAGPTGLGLGVQGRFR
jgi:hypothetical protein